ncbi:branched-chain amino acid ABC transporter permease [Undibacterium terreum]|uniref:Branched-chain amino acid ABC transporter permease n=1 Tax=Undibacterium terreum TaxID=1224302 RepID=A0A916XS79_9BURK|nr:branched-chain amino acid ABC transporter permease [Undibacterium terreum]GGC96537.1 branched-chain amino acid ABC transporter permease [Undibacterium terreum]
MQHLSDKLGRKLPQMIIPLVMLTGLILVPNLPTWITLTIAGLAMGMMIFIMASGLTLVFGLMDVMNFGHGVFIAIGAFVATSVLLPMAGWMQAENAALNLIAIGIAMAAAALVSGLLGWAFERLIIRPVYGQHLKQILITTGGLIIAEQLIHAIWGPEQISLARPASLRGAWIFGDVAVEKFRVIAVVLGLLIFIAMWLILNRSKIGLLVRAGVENPEMVETLGYKIRRLFIGVFVAGSALAGLGGVLWGLYQETVSATMGAQLMVLIFIVIIIGGLGSVGGCFAGALLVGLMANYVGFLAPKIALGANILLMVLILLWRPQGLFPVASR